MDTHLNVALLPGMEKLRGGAGLKSGLLLELCGRAAFSGAIFLCRALCLVLVVEGSFRIAGDLICTGQLLYGD
ncbi:MAG: hypothetical protein P4N59_23525 [Negativicutes bacterium]|nr:hypothetical protein [Negativicutes bacterium]